LRPVKSPELTADATVDHERVVGSGAVDASLSASYSSTVYHDIFDVMNQSPYATFNAQAGYIGLSVDYAYRRALVVKTGPPTYLLAVSVVDPSHSQRQCGKALMENCTWWPADGVLVIAIALARLRAHGEFVDRIEQHCG
jgi:hypothetical protein